jgi:spore germination cell wall hydrolase CwlJ-like protein
MKSPNYGNISLWIAAIVCLILLVPTLAASDENGERYCLAQNIYFESANQPFAGRVAVANVAVNRSNDAQFPSTICDVVYQAKLRENWKGNMVPIRNKCQFSWYCDGKSDEPTDSTTWMESLHIADLVISGKMPDITSGSLWYHADFVSPYWAPYLTEVVTIDNHIFYK